MSAATTTLIIVIRKSRSRRADVFICGGNNSNIDRTALCISTAPNDPLALFNSSTPTAASTAAFATRAFLISTAPRPGKNVQLSFFLDKKSSFNFFNF